MYSKSEFINEIDNICRLRNLKDDFISEADNYDQIYLYGAGHACHFYLDYLTRNGVKVSGIIDGNSKKWGGTI